MLKLLTNINNELFYLTQILHFIIISIFVMFEDFLCLFKQNIFCRLNCVDVSYFTILVTCSTDSVTIKYIHRKKNIERLSIIVECTIFFIRNRRIKLFFESSKTVFIIFSFSVHFIQNVNNKFS